MKNWKIKIGIWLVMISKLSYGQDISFSSEYNQIKWPLSLGVGGGLVGDDGNYKRLSLFHGHSISLQTGTNTPNISNSRLYISSTGAVGVGTTSPEATFHLVGGFRQGGTGAFNVDASGVVGGRFKILENGNVGVGTADPLARLDVRGGATNVDYLTVRPQGGPEGGEITLQGGAGYPAWQLDILNNQFRLHSQGSVLLSVENSGFIAGAGNASFRDLISGGSNAWLLHTPDDGRSELFLAPMIDQKWAFDKQFVFKNDGMMQLNSASITSKLGIGTTAPLASMHVKGGGLILGSNSVVENTDGYLSMGDASKNSSPATYTWGTETTLLLTNQDYSTIGFHDAGDRVDFIRAGKGTIQLGYDGGYGSASVGLPNGVWNSLGNVGIGTTNPGAYKLAVEGKIGAREVEVKTGSWADFVFKDDYKLRPIEEVEKYIAAHSHLPEIPSEEKVKAEGVNLGEMNVKLLQKIEELTLYMIQQQHELNTMKNQITKLVEDSKKK